MRFLTTVFLLLCSLTLAAREKSFPEWCVESAMSNKKVEDSLRDVGAVCYDSIIIVHGLESHSGLNNLELRVYSLSLQPLHKVMVSRPAGGRCVSVIPVQNTWWILYAEQPTASPVPVYAGSTSNMQGQTQAVYFTNMYKPVPGAITGILVLDSAFNRVTNKVVADQNTLTALNDAMKFNSDLGTNNYPVFTGQQLVWNVAKEIHCAEVVDAHSGMLKKKWTYTLVGATISTVNLLGVTDSAVLITYSSANPAQVMMEGISVGTGTRFLQRNLTDTSGTIFPSRLVKTPTGFLLAGGYVARLVGPYPYTYTQTSTGSTRYFGRIDGTFIAEFDEHCVQQKIVRSVLPIDLRELPEDKFSIKACRFALCAELQQTPTGVMGIFEIVETKPPYEPVKFNRRAPNRMEQHYLPASRVCGVMSMKTNISFSEAEVNYRVWDQAADFLLNRNSWDYFSTVYPGPQTTCFRSLRSNPAAADEPNPDAYPGLLLGDNLQSYPQHARQAFPGEDNSPLDIQSVFLSGNNVFFHFTIQDTLNQAWAFSSPFSYCYSIKEGTATISSTGSRRVIYRINEQEVITFSVNDKENKYTLLRESL